jgi:hypothetical protein
MDKGMFEDSKGQSFNHLKNISHTDQFWFHRLL